MKAPESYAEFLGSCSICNWTNVSLINLGEPNKPRMVCQGCCKRAVDKMDEILALTQNTDLSGAASASARKDGWADCQPHKSGDLHGQATKLPGGNTMIKCKCGNPWMKQKNLAAYDGEVVLVCIKCKERYYNAQEWFTDDELSLVKEIDVKADTANPTGQGRSDCGAYPGPGCSVDAKAS